MALESTSSAGQALLRKRVMRRGTTVRPFAQTRERGVFAIMFVPLLLVMVAFCGLALDAGQLYNRKADLSGMSKAVALAPARELNGTDAGITEAKTKARETAEAFRSFGMTRL